MGLASWLLSFFHSRLDVNQDQDGWRLVPAELTIPLQVTHNQCPPDSTGWSFKIRSNAVKVKKEAASTSSWYTYCCLRIRFTVRHDTTYERVLVATQHKKELMSQHPTISIKKKSYAVLLSYCKAEHQTLAWEWYTQPSGSRPSRSCKNVG